MPNLVLENASLSMNEIVPVLCILPDLLSHQFGKSPGKPGGHIGGGLAVVCLMVKVGSPVTGAAPGLQVGQHFPGSWIGF